MKIIVFFQKSGYLIGMMKIRLPNCGVRAEIALAAGIAAGAAMPPLFALFPAVAALVFLRRRSGLLLLAGILLGALSAGVRDCRWFSPDDYRWKLPVSDCYGEVYLRIADRRLTTVPGIAAPGLIMTEVSGFRLSGEHAVTAATGILYCRWPENVPVPHFGETAVLRGAFETPRSGSLIRQGGVWRSFIEGRSFGDFLAGRGSARLFDADDATVSGYEPGWMGPICTLRDYVLKTLLTGVEDPMVRNWSAALFFGISGGISGEENLSLIESGTIHLFSVSGMHVAVLAALLLYFLNPLPFRWRYRILNGIVFCYVMTTGAGAPALRAFFMIALWGEMRCRLLWIPPVSALALAAALLLLWNPALICEAGFLYSFLITALLLLAAELCRPETELWRERFRLMPSAPLRMKQERRFMRRRRLLLAFAGCCIAFLGGAGISLFSQGLVLPGSIAANLLLLPLVALLYPVLLLKLILTWIGGASPGAWFLTVAFKALHGIVCAAAEFFPRLPVLRPALWEIIVFYLLLFGAFGGRFIWRCSAGAAALLLALSWQWRVGMQLPSLLYGYGGSGDVPVAAVAEPAAGIGVAVNVPGYDSAAAYTEFFMRRGITRIETLYLSNLRMNHISGIASLLRHLPVERIIVPSADRSSSRALAKLRTEAPNVPVFTASDGEAYGPGRIQPEKAGFSFEYQNSGSGFRRKFFWRKHDAGWTLSAEKKNAKTLQKEFAFGSVLEVLCSD